MLQKVTADRTTLKVVLANPRGFCAGVVRAIDIVEQAIERHGAPVYVRHEIVHNRHVVDTLRAKGAVFVDHLADIPEGALTIFSAHGVARSVEDEARMRDLPVIDATCPLVTKVHVQGRRYAKAGRTLVLIGHQGHAEVDGTMGQIDAPIHLVQSVEDVAAEKVKLQHTIERQKADLSLLQADWAYLNQPANVAPVVNRHLVALNLQTLSQDQFGSLDILPMRLKAPDTNALNSLFQSLNSGVDPIQQIISESN